MGQPPRVGRTNTLFTYFRCFAEFASWETKARLFRTAGGKFVAGAEIYNRTKEQYEARAAVKADSLAELVEKVRQTSCLDDDELAELFQHTEVADSLVEKVE
jgi:hypothetical protein